MYVDSHPKPEQLDSILKSSKLKSFESRVESFEFLVECFEFRVEKKQKTYRLIKFSQG